MYRKPIGIIEDKIKRNNSWIHHTTDNCNNNCIYTLSMNIVNVFPWGFFVSILRFLYFFFFF